MTYPLYGEWGRLYNTPSHTMFSYTLSTVTTLHLSKSLPITFLFSVLVFSCCIKKRSSGLYFCALFTSLSRTFSSPIHFTANNKISFVFIVKMHSILYVYTYQKRNEKKEISVTNSIWKILNVFSHQENTNQNAKIPSHHI